MDPTGLCARFRVVSDAAEFYKTTEYWYPQHERSLLWSDPALGIRWPLSGRRWSQPGRSRTHAGAGRRLSVTRPVILLTGAAGQPRLGLARLLTAHGEVEALDRAALDRPTPTRCRGDGAPVQTADHRQRGGLTAVDRAESEPALADAINARPAVRAEEAKRLDALLIHYSTDYVFDGSSRQPYREEDQANPLNVYGISKLAGERAIRAAGGAHLILRTSWILRIARSQNFLLTMRRLAATRDELRVVADQLACPTGAVRWPKRRPAW